MIEYETVAKAFNMSKAPVPGLIVDLVEYVNSYALRIYRDNIESFSDPQKLLIAEHLYRLRDTIRDLGVSCGIQGVEHSPPNWRK